MTKDGRQVLAELEEIVWERGEDYVYQEPGGQDKGCWYVHGGREPGCIAGVWMHRYAGVPLEKLSEHEGVRAPRVIADLELDIDGEARGVLGSAQQMQDQGETWGRALEVTRTRLDAGDVAQHGWYA